MARNIEKGRSMLNQWLKIQDIDSLHERNNFFKVPKNVNSVDNLEDAENYRKIVMKEMCKKINEIQNCSLSEQYIRDLNDEINKLMSIKNRWEIRIVYLGGPDYQSESNTLINAHSSEIKGNNSYRYFGAAKNLKGVKELLEREREERNTVEKKRRRESKMKKLLNNNYLGYKDHYNIKLIKAERIIENKLINEDLNIFNKIDGLKNNNQGEARV